jgi:hypothetical protein
MVFSSLAGNALLAPQGNTSTVTSWIDIATAVGCGACKLFQLSQTVNRLIAYQVITPLQFACMKAVPFQALENTIIAESAPFALVPDGMFVITQCIGGIKRLPCIQASLSFRIQPLDLPRGSSSKYHFSLEAMHKRGTSSSSPWKN